MRLELTPELVEAFRLQAQAGVPAENLIRAGLANAMG
jgi:hypothetical protein